MSTPANEKPDTNVYRVRRDTRLAQGLFLAKIIIKKHGSVQIEGMGESISLVAKLAQILAKDGFVNTKSLQALDIGENKTINPKLVITLTKSAKFDELTKDIVPRKE
jgi:hypothetical protein